LSPNPNPLDSGLASDEAVNILLVDDEPAKLLSYQVMLNVLGENLISVSSGREALGQLLKNDIALVLIDVCMPELDGFQLAAMIRDHPRFRRTAIIFISAIHLTDVDRVRGYQLGAVDYVPVPVVPEVLRAKVRIFIELYRKTRELEKLNEHLERRVLERTAELQSSTAQLLQSEQLRGLALAAGRMGTWQWDIREGKLTWDEGQFRIFGVDPHGFDPTPEQVCGMIDPQDLERMRDLAVLLSEDGQTHQTEFRVLRPNGEVRWCIGSAAASRDSEGRIVRMSGVTVDITDRKEAEERQALLSREIDHRARNALSVAQSIMRLSRGKTRRDYVAVVEGRIGSLARTHDLLSKSRWIGADLRTIVNDELAPYRDGNGKITTSGPNITLPPATAQILALAFHELATNAAKYGALSSISGCVRLAWQLQHGTLIVTWAESLGSPVRPPTRQGYGVKMISTSVERQLGGHARFDWRPEGLHCTLTLPFTGAKAVAEQKSASAADPDKARVVKSKGLVADRVLLVEDEALIGMMMKNMLTELGLSVVGPYARMGDALSAARDESFDAAILDVNLDGELTYQIAEILIDRNLPFAFVTGYGTQSIDERFAQIPIIQKPIARGVLQNVFAPRTRAARRVTGAD
jgi:two-component sensor histidine kinase/DNA-binding response OmpR family regulator